MAAGVLLTCNPFAAVAQDPAPVAPGGPAQNKPVEQPLVSVNARDADVRQVLEDIFRQAKIANYAISNAVSGTVTLTVRDKPFEETLTLISRVASSPLSWSKTDDVYLVRPRPVRQSAETDLSVTPPAPAVTALASGGVRYEVIKLMYADPRAVVDLFDLLRPANLTAAVAIEASNDVLTRWGPDGSADFVAATMPVEWNRSGQSSGAGRVIGGVAAPLNNSSIGTAPIPDAAGAPLR